MASVSRRSFLAGSVCSLYIPAIAVSASDKTSLTESQQGDPNSQPEFITYEPSKIERLTSRTHKGLLGPKIDNFGLSLISQANHFLGTSRATSPDQVTEFLSLFDFPFQDREHYVPFCAAGLSFTALRTYITELGSEGTPPTKTAMLKYFPEIDNYYFYPTVSVNDMYLIAQGRHRWVERKRPPEALPKAGWIVLYDWNNSGVPDHCGIVTHAKPSQLNTIEFNTSGIAGGSQRDGGTVSEKTRNYDHVKGYIRI